MQPIRNNPANNPGPIQPVQLPPIHKITALFQTITNQNGQARLQDLEQGIRLRVPRRLDPELTSLIQRENATINVIESNPVHLSAHLQGLGNRQVDLQVRNGQQQERYSLWKASPQELRLLSDNSASKFQRLLTTVNNRNPLKWLDTRTKCSASVLTNSEATFCKDQGVLVYGAPQSYDAIASIAAHDISSPSEGGPQPPVASEGVKNYLVDLKKVEIATDYVFHLREQFRQEMEDAGSYQQELAMLLNRPPKSTEKHYFTGNPQDVNLVVEIRLLKALAQQHPDLAKAVGIQLQDLDSLEHAVHDYLYDPAVVHRGTQHEQINGWESSEQSNPDGPLNAKARTIGTEIAQLTGVLHGYGVLSKNYVELDTEGKNYAQAIAWVNGRQDQFFGNIFHHSLTGESLQEAIEHTRALKSRYAELQTELTGVNRAALAQMQQQTFDQLTQKVEEAQALVNMVYNEIQIRPDRMRISSLGVKKKNYRDLRNKDIAALKDEEQDYTRRIVVIETILKNMPNQLHAGKGLAANLATLKARRQPITELLTTHAAVKAGERLNLPVFIHRGT